MNKDHFYMDLASLISTQGTCPRLQVGALVVREGRILAIGYNGSPRGDSHCGCIVDSANHCVKAVHAEANVIANAAFSGTPLKDATLYSTHLPCERCFPLLVNAGIQRIFYENEYKNRISTLQHKLIKNIQKLTKKIVLTT